MANYSEWARMLMARCMALCVPLLVWGCQPSQSDEDSRTETRAQADRDTFAGEVSDVYIPAQNRALYFLGQTKESKQASPGTESSRPVAGVVIELEEFPGKRFYADAETAMKYGFLIDRSTVDKWTFVTAGLGRHVVIEAPKGKLEIISIRSEEWRNGGS